MAKDKPSRPSGPADFYGSSFRLWKRTKRNGAPRWVWASVGAVSVVGVGAAIALYFAAHSLLVSGVFVGIAFLADAAILNFADMSSATDRRDGPPAE